MACEARRHVAFVNGPQVFAMKVETMMNYRMFSLGAMALALFVVGAPAFAAEEAKEAMHDGKVVSITSSKLVMTNKGKDDKEHTHTLATDAKVTLDGKTCKAEELRAGMKIRVTTKSSDTKVATQIEAIDKNETFANTHDGKVISITSDKLMMTNKDGTEHSHSVSTDTKVTLDGKVCKSSDLKSGMKIRVTTKKTDVGVAIGIEAIDKDSGFAQRG